MKHTSLGSGSASRAGHLSNLGVLASFFLFATASFAEAVFMGAICRVRVIRFPPPQRLI